MILAETTETIENLYGRRLRDITVKRAVVGLFFTGVRLSTGFGGISYTPAADIHKDPGFGSVSLPLSSGSFFKGMSVHDLLHLATYPPLLSTVRLAALNALSAPFFLTGNNRYAITRNTDALHFLENRGAGKIAMVGAITPFVETLKAMKDTTLYVIEKKRQSLKRDARQYYVPSKKAAEVIPLCDTVIITGAAVANGSMVELLSYARPQANVIVSGPTVSFVPDALFARGVTMVSGAIVTKIEKTLDMLAEGGGAYHLFSASCLRKFNITATRGQGQPNSR